MVLELATITVLPGHEDVFEAAYGQARFLVLGAQGCRSVRMTRGVESPNTFVLLIEWDSVEAHVENFREQPVFEQWRALIGPHFANPPHVEHFADVG